MRRRMLANLGGWKNPYITDGLVAMWDGEHNTGNGWSDDISKFRDCVTGGIVPMGDTNPVSFGLSFWDANYTVVKNGLKCNTLGKYVGFAMETGLVFRRNYTFDIVVTNHNRRTSTASNASDIISIYPWSQKVEFFLYRGLSVRVNNVATETYTYPGNTLNTLTLVPSGICMNGNTLKTVDLWDLNYPDAKGLGFGTNGSVATLHCARVYNRALSSHEIAHNYAIDKERFGLS